MDNILHMVGLAMKAGRLEVGEEPVGAACRARDCRLILVAWDAADNSFRRVKHFADAGQCLWVSVPYTKEELGQAVGRRRSSASRRSGPPSAGRNSRPTSAMSAGAGKSTAADEKQSYPP